MSGVDHIHEETRTIVERIEYPGHEPRAVSPEFARNRRILVRQLGLGCWICGAKAGLEVHHLHEWSLFEALDPEKVLDNLHTFDPYGYTHKMGEQPIKDPDDIRNLLVLCETHHRGRDTGVHELTFPPWFAERATKDGVSITSPVGVSRRPSRPLALDPNA